MIELSQVSRSFTVGDQQIAALRGTNAFLAAETIWVGSRGLYKDAHYPQKIAGSIFVILTHAWRLLMHKAAHILFRGFCFYGV